MHGHIHKMFGKIYILINVVFRYSLKQLFYNGTIFYLSSIYMQVSSPKCLDFKIHVPVYILNKRPKALLYVILGINVTLLRINQMAFDEELIVVIQLVCMYLEVGQENSNLLKQERHSSYPRKKNIYKNCDQRIMSFINCVIGLHAHPNLYLKVHYQMLMFNI